MVWPSYPKRLLYSLKALCCLAHHDRAMQAHEIAEKIGVSTAETGKVMQLMVWGGFAGSKRGSKGGFHLATSPDQITTGEVIQFFFSKCPPEPDGDCPVMRILREYSAPCQEAFGRLTLADIVAESKRLHEVALAEREVVTV